MNATSSFDDQVLNAFVDGQLDIETSESIINEMDKNAEVREHVYQLRRAKDLIRLGFNNPPLPFEVNTSLQQSRWHHIALSLAASLTAITISLGSGAFGFYYAKHKQITVNEISQSTNQQNAERILLHISESNTKEFADALEFTESFLQSHTNSGGQIAVVANAGGLDLLRAGTSPFEKQIRSMMKNYDNVYFIACANTIKYLHEKGINLKFIDKVQTKKPAMDHIIDYVRDGWTYKKVNSSEML